MRRILPRSALSRLPLSGAVCPEVALKNARIKVEGNGVTASKTTRLVSTRAIHLIDVEDAVAVTHVAMPFNARARGWDRRFRRRNHCDGSSVRRILARENPKGRDA